MHNPFGPGSSPSEDEPFRSIFDAATDGIILADTETEAVVEANPAACAMHGYARQAFVGLHLPAFIHPDSQSTFAQCMQTLRARSASEAQVRDVRRDGSTFHAAWRVTAFAYGGRPCLLGIVRDVSRRIQAEELLHAARRSPHPRAGCAAGHLARPGLHAGT